MGQCGDLRGVGPITVRVAGQEMAAVWAWVEDRDEDARDILDRMPLVERVALLAQLQSLVELVATQVGQNPAGHSPSGQDTGQDSSAGEDTGQDRVPGQSPSGQAARLVRRDTP